MSRARLAIAAALLTIACGGGTEPPDPTVPATIELSFDTLTDWPGYIAYLPTTTIYNGSHQIIPSQIIWSSADTTIAAIRGGGTVLAKKQGKVDLIVTAKNASAVAHLTITREPVTNVVPNPRESHLYGYDSLQFSAWAVGPAGDSLPDRTVTISTSEPQIVSLSPTNMLHLQGSGVAYIVVASEGVKDSAFVIADPRTVTRMEVVPDSVSISIQHPSSGFIVRTFDAAGEELYDRPQHWSSSNPAVATVQFGDISPVSTGTAIISVRVDSTTTNIPLVVTAGP